MNILLKYFQSHSKRLTILTDKEKTTFSSILCGMEMCYVDINVRNGEILCYHSDVNTMIF